MIVQAGSSLLWRIVVRLAATTLIAIVVAYSWLWWRYETTSEALRDRSLTDQATAIAARLELRPGGQLDLGLPEAMVEAYAQSRGDHRYAVRDRASGEVLLHAGDPVAPLPLDGEGEDGGTFYQYDPDGPGPNHIFGVAIERQVDGRLFTVQVEQSGRDYEALTRSLVEGFFADGGWLGAPLLLALLAVSIFTIRSSLAPLREVSEQAAAIGPASTDVRLPEQGVPREIRPLVHAVNSALDRLEAGFRAQREFTADAAHELRTPLAVLRAQVDSLPDPAARASLARDLDAMARLVGQLLRVAQVEAMTIAIDETADLNVLAVDVGVFLAPMALQDGRLVEVVEAAVPVVVRGNAEALFNALRNLVENALAHTPKGSTVTVTVSSAPPAVSVRDHGPGVPEELRERIFQRFWRAERRSSGAGLGLAIVRGTMEAHGGTVAVGEAPGGGAVFTLGFAGE